MAAAAAAAADAPPLCFAVRGRQGMSMVQGPGSWRTLGWKSECTDNMDFDASGTLVAAYGRAVGRAEVWNANSGELLFSAAVERALEVQMSPKGTQLAVWRSPSMESREPNCFIFAVPSGEEVTRLWLPQWPCLFWTQDESQVLVHMPAHISIHTSLAEPPVGTLDGRWTKLALSSSSPACLCMAAVPPEKQRQERPTVVHVVRMNKPGTVLIGHEVNLDDAELLWNKKGSACILNASLDWDATGRSYYGEVACFLLRVQEKKVLPISTGRQAIHDVCWAPSGNEFIVVYGRMPDNKATLFNERGVVLHNFEIAPRNTVSWAPHTRFLALAGFGNLPGDVEIWDREKLDQGAKARVGSFRVSSVTRHQWAPDSRHFMVATCHPRMTTDNMVAVYKSNGERVWGEKFDEIYAASWLPRPAKLYPPRDPSPPPRSAAAKPAPKAAVFRAAGVGMKQSSLAAEIRAQMSASQTRGGGYAGVSRPGATDASFGWRDGKDAAPGVPGADVPGADAGKEKKKRKEKPKETAAGAVDQAPIDDFTTKEYKDTEKAAKAVQKRLQQAAQLRNKDPAMLGADQKAKVAQWANLKAEVEYLQGLMAKGVTSQP